MWSETWIKELQSVREEIDVLLESSSSSDITFDTVLRRFMGLRPSIGTLPVEIRVHIVRTTIDARASGTLPLQTLAALSCNVSELDAMICEWTHGVVGTLVEMVSLGMEMRSTLRRWSNTLCHATSTLYGPMVWIGVRSNGGRDWLRTVDSVHPVARLNVPTRWYFTYESLSVHKACFVHSRPIEFGDTNVYFYVRHAMCPNPVWRAFSMPIITLSRVSSPPRWFRTLPDNVEGMVTNTDAQSP